MPTKKPTPTKTARKQSFTPAQVDAIANTVQDHAVRIQVVATAMRTFGVKSMPIDAGSKVGDAMLRLEAFVAKAQQALDQSGRADNK